MEKELVTNSQALLLKELGFKERCNYYCENDKLKLHNNKNGWDFNSSFIECYSKPFKQQVFDWFRKEHGLFCYIKESLKSKTTCYKIHNHDDKNYGPYTQPNLIEITEFVEKNYNETELICINELIKIIQK